MVLLRLENVERRKRLNSALFPKIAEHTSVPDMTKQTVSAIPKAQDAKRWPKLIGCCSINVKNDVARPIKTQGTLEQIETNQTRLPENLNL